MPYLVYDERYLDHTPPFTHPENPERLTSIIKGLKDRLLFDSFELVVPRAATEQELELVHPRSLIHSISSLSAERGGLVDMDTYVSPASYQTALLAVGGNLEAVDRVMAVGGRALCLVRPPGHHATLRRAMGFCLFNNVAVAAAYACKRHGVGRVAIVDIDVHHGNGTQEIFWSDPTVLYISMHQMPLYPGSGASSETGEGAGAGFTLNIPLDSGTGDDEYLQMFRATALPKILDFGPEIIFVSLGFDAMAEDPLATLSLTEKAYAEVTRELIRVADSSAGGKIVISLEGGYDLDAIARGVSAVATELLS